MSDQNGQLIHTFHLTLCLNTLAYAGRTFGSFDRLMSSRLDWTGLDWAEIFFKDVPRGTMEAMHAVGH